MMCCTEESCKDENTAGEETMDVIIQMKDNVQVGPFQTDFERKGCTSACQRYSCNGSTYQAH